MAFTNVWNDTFPPDTQLANLLGQDLRNFRVDVQQRMAAISGLDASKPAFGSDNTPANWNGILFFAIDTGNIYQFNNPSWTNVTSILRASSATTKRALGGTPTTNGTGQTLFSLSFPIASIQTLSAFHIAVSAAVTSGAGCNLQLTIGGLSLVTYQPGVTTATMYADGVFGTVSGSNYPLAISGAFNTTGNGAANMQTFSTGGTAVQSGGNLTFVISQFGAGALSGNYMTTQIFF